MFWLHLANNKMYDFSDKPTSRTTLSRCRLLARYKPRLGMQKEADPSDSSAKGIRRQHPSFRCIPLFWSPQTSVGSEVIVSVHRTTVWNILWGCQVLITVNAVLYHKCLLTVKLCDYGKKSSTPTSQRTSLTVIAPLKKVGSHNVQVRSLTRLTAQQRLESYLWMWRP